MNWSDFRKAVDSGDIAPVYLFTGTEAYIKRESLEHLRRAILPPGLAMLNESVMEGATAQAITEACETLPVMCDRRLVTVRDWAPLMSGKSRDEETEVKAMLTWLENPPQTCTLVFYMREEPDGRKKLTDALKKKAAVVSFDPLTDAELTKWCQKQVKLHGKTISPQVVSRLSFMAGRELTRLSGELEKLCAYAGEEGGEITLQHVAAIVSPSLEYNIFELMNQLLAADMSGAQKTVNQLIEGGQNAMGILAMLTRQLRQLTHMKLALDAGDNVTSVQNTLKLHPYAARQTARQCRNLSANWLQSMYDLAVNADYSVKQGKLRDMDALNRLLFSIGFHKTGATAQSR